MLKVDSDIPIPPSYDKGYTRSVKALKYGESVFLPSSIASIHNLIRRLYLTGFAERGTYTAKTEFYGTILGTRVWRKK